MSDKAKKALDDARRFAEEGKYDEALAKHVWFHEYALDYEPSFYGVRLSFALSDWVELGNRYPEALEKLREIRDEKTTHLELGDEDEELFHDVSSINMHLDDHQATTSLFKILDSQRKGFARSVFKEAFYALAITEEFTLAGKYLLDPISLFEEAKSLLNKSLRHCPVDIETLRNGSALYFITSVSHLILVLDTTNDLNFAMIIRRKTREALKEFGCDVDALLIEHPILSDPFQN